MGRDVYWSIMLPLCWATLTNWCLVFEFEVYCSFCKSEPTVFSTPVTSGLSCLYRVLFSIKKNDHQWWRMAVACRTCTCSWVLVDNVSGCSRPTTCCDLDPWIKDGPILPSLHAPLLKWTWSEGLRATLYMVWGRPEHRLDSCAIKPSIRPNFINFCGSNLLTLDRRGAILSPNVLEGNV